MTSLRITAIFIVGMTFGLVVMAYLSSKASVTWSKNLAIIYAVEEQEQGALAVKNGNWQDATEAYGNVAAFEEKGNKIFGVGAEEWDILFPIAALVLERVFSDSDPTGRGHLISASLANIKYAYALEMNGHFKEAEIIWNKVLKNDDFKSIESAKNQAKYLINQDIELMVKY